MKHSAPGADHQMLATRFVDGPHALALDEAAAILEGWLAELAPDQSSAIKGLIDLPHVREILLGLAGFSPYLFDLIRADPARLIRVLRCDPEPHLGALIEGTSH